MLDEHEPGDKERGSNNNGRMCDDGGGCHPRALLMLSWNLIVG